MNDSFMLVIGLYTYDDLLDHTAHAFEGYDLFNGLADPGHKLLWECIRDTYLHTGVKPTPYMLGQQGLAHLISVDSLMRPKAEEQLRGVFEALSKPNWPNMIKREHVRKLLEAASRRAAVDKLLNISVQQHETTAELVENSFRDHLILQAEVPKYDGDLTTPNVYVELEEETLDRKIEYLFAGFPTQADRYWFTEDTFRGIARIRGVESKASSGFAEGFHCRKLVLS